MLPNAALLHFYEFYDNLHETQLYAYRLHVLNSPKRIVWLAACRFRVPSALKFDPTLSCPPRVHVAPRLGVLVPNGIIWRQESDSWLGQA